MSHHRYDLLFPEQITAGRYHYLIYYFDRTNGRRVVWLDPYPGDEDDHNTKVFYHEEGNGGCDCNRSLYMYDYEMPDGDHLAEGVTLSGEDDDSYSCRDDHPLYPDNKIIIERMICLETGETVARNI
jgi:hypothetical protein